MKSFRVGERLARKVIRRRDSRAKDLEAAMHLKNFLDAANQSTAAVNRKIIDITQRNFNLSLDLAKSLAGARYPSEIVKLQAGYWRKQFDELTTQAEEVRNRLFGFPAAESTPESAPESALQEPTKRSPPLGRNHSPASRDHAVASLNKKSETREAEAPPPTIRTAGSEARLANERQLKIRKTITAEKRSARDQRPRPTSRDRTQEQEPQGAARTTLKARPSSSPGRQSRIQKKGAPQSLPTHIKFGLLDGNAVRFTNLEAWWLVDGTWRPISLGEVLSSAAVLREARFKQLFPQVPLLPKKAFQSDSR